mmetsp:Transcript_41782/g.105348  ORF Transcript_41782/g.105348 Transcript_41782/m.105348 type:complete len:212 (+) Transcript_41782:8296-8931(+)
MDFAGELFTLLVSTLLQVAVVGGTRARARKLLEELGHISGRHKVSVRRRVGDAGRVQEQLSVLVLAGGERMAQQTAHHQVGGGERVDAAGIHMEPAQEELRLVSVKVHVVRQKTSRQPGRRHVGDHRVADAALAAGRERERVGPVVARGDARLVDVGQRLQEHGHRVVVLTVDGRIGGYRWSHRDVPLSVGNGARVEDLELNHAAGRGTGC